MPDKTLKSVSRQKKDHHEQTGQDRHRENNQDRGRCQAFCPLAPYPRGFSVLRSLPRHSITARYAIKSCSERRKDPNRSEWLHPIRPGSSGGLADRSETQVDSQQQTSAWGDPLRKPAQGRHRGAAARWTATRLRVRRPSVTFFPGTSCIGRTSSAPFVRLSS